MIIVAKVLLCCFGVIGGSLMLNFLCGSYFGWSKMIIMVISIFIVAISAGYVYGGLFQ